MALEAGDLISALRQRHTMQNRSDFSLSSTWEILGPFQIGTREAAWGADPLELYGGFRNLSFDPTASFASSLPPDGLVKWSTVTAEGIRQDSQGARLSLSLTFPQVQWDFLRTVYGWAAVQFQGWARGTITVAGDGAQAFVLYTDSILEFWLDDEHYFGGDFYTFRRAPPVLWLEPGEHRLDVRLVRDVRAFGGVGDPSIAVTIQLNRSSETLELATEGINLSDFVNDSFASPVAAVTVRNAGRDTIRIQDVTSLNTSARAILSDRAIQLVPGQTRSVPFMIFAESDKPTTIRISIHYASVAANTTSSLQIEQPVRIRNVLESHKVTYTHPGGIVSYVMLRPPQPNASCAADHPFPILLFLHGAGNEADTDPVRNIFEPVKDVCAWALSVTGVTPWSSDDWHNWGFADVQAAVLTIDPWIENIGWSGPGVDTSRWLVSGHSNGGQGTWYALTHHPDNVIAAVPVSGYLSIQTYVPYHLWRLTDPQKFGIVQATTNSYRHELLISNSIDIPIHQQHGGADDNVPPYNSRSMFSLIREVGWTSNYTEIPNSPHYFDGVMTTPNLQAFYRAQLDVTRPATTPDKQFVLTVANPGDTGSKRGFRVSQLQDPGQLGRLMVSTDAVLQSVHVQTSNILSFELPSSLLLNELVIDNQSVSTQPSAYVCVRSLNGTWQLQSHDDERRRKGRQLGPLDSIMRSLGRFNIRYKDPVAAATALQVSRNLQQYYYADADITTAFTMSSPTNGNVFTIALGNSVPASILSDFPIHINDAGEIYVIRFDGTIVTYGEDVVAAIFLRPLEDESLELVVWGRDQRYLQIAARLVPMQTGVGQPDFLLLGKASLWKGLDGVIASGFFDSDWRVSAGSYFS